MWRFVDTTRPMFIVGFEPSTGAVMFAVPHTAPECERASTRSLATPPRPKLSSWKLPAASVNPST